MLRIDSYRSRKVHLTPVWFLSQRFQAGEGTLSWWTGHYAEAVEASCAIFSPIGRTELILEAQKLIQHPDPMATF